MPLFAWKLLGYAVLALTLMGTGAKLMSDWDSHKIVTMRAELTAAAAQAHATTLVQKAITKADTSAETSAQAAITQRAHIIYQERTRYVPQPGPSVAVPCVSNGMLRLHDAAILGADPGDLEPPAGQSDDACSTLSASDFMGLVANNYAAARANAEQLDALEADIVARGQAITDPGATQPPAPVINPGGSNAP